MSAPIGSRPPTFSPNLEKIPASTESDQETLRSAWAIPLTAGLVLLIVGVNALSGGLVIGVALLATGIFLILLSIFKLTRKSKMESSSVNVEGAQTRKVLGYSGIIQSAVASTNPATEQERAAMIRV